MKKFPFIPILTITSFTTACGSTYQSPAEDCTDDKEYVWVDRNGIKGCFTKIEAGRYFSE